VLAGPIVRAPPTATRAGADTVVRAPQDRGKRKDDAIDRFAEYEAKVACKLRMRHASLLPLPRCRKLARELRVQPTLHQAGRERRYIPSHRRRASADIFPSGCAAQSGQVGGFCLLSDDVRCGFDSTLDIACISVQARGRLPMRA